MPAQNNRGRLRLGVLASGRGTNLQAILDAVARGELYAQVALVVCNHRDVPAAQRAIAAGVPVEVYDRADYPNRLAEQTAVAEKLRAAQVDLVVCAGWDRIFRPEFIREFEGRIINVHPSLLPAFAGGLHAVEQALQYGVKITGCTVHFVTDEVDAGPIIAQAAVPVPPDDTVETLSARIHKEEHRLLVEAIRLYGEHRLAVKGRVVQIISDQGSAISDQSELLIADR